MADGSSYLAFECISDLNLNTDRPDILGIPDNSRQVRKPQRQPHHPAPPPHPPTCSSAQARDNDPLLSSRQAACTGTRDTYERAELIVAKWMFGKGVWGGGSGYSFHTFHTFHSGLNQSKGCHPLTHSQVLRVGVGKTCEGAVKKKGSQRSVELLQVMIKVMPFRLLSSMVNSQLPLCLGISSI